MGAFQKKSAKKVETVQRGEENKCRKLETPQLKIDFQISPQL